MAIRLISSDQKIEGIQFMISNSKEDLWSDPPNNMYHLTNHQAKNRLLKLQNILIQQLINNLQSSHN